MEKKEYVAPAVYSESFDLAQHVSSCGLSMNSASEITCEGQITEDFVDQDPAFGGSQGQMMFAPANQECDVKDEYYCYTNGTNSGPLFGS